VFLYGFPNIGTRELDDLKKLAGYYLNFTQEEIVVALRQTELRELVCDEEDEA
jgi:hypothetical protein